MHIKLCPFCGHNIGRPLSCGMATCENCNRLFDSSEFYQCLSASWVCRKWHIEDPYTLQAKFDFSPQIVDLVTKYVIEACFSHDEFLAVVEEETHLDRSA